MQNARTALKALLAVSCLSAALSVIPVEIRAAAGGSQSCTVGVTCKTGEFLYDDASVPIAGATCTITSKYPDNTSYLNAVAMSGGGADGWYYYEFTTPSTQGVYATTVCCTTSGDTLCIDKSFEVVAAESTASEIATSVWSHSGRTLSSFGTLAADIWSYSTRTVSSFGTLVSDIWKNATRTLSGTSDVAEVKKSTDDVRLLLEKVVNKPIIVNVLEEKIPDLGSKIKDTKAIANQLYVNSLYLTSQAASLGASWKTRSGKELLSGVIEISAVLGEESDLSSANTVFGQVNWIKSSWDWEEAGAISQRLIATQKRISLLKQRLSSYKKDQAQYLEVKALTKDFLALEKLIGTANDGSYQQTLYSRIKATQEIIASLEEKLGQVEKVLAGLTKSSNPGAAARKIEDLQKEVIAVNKVPGVAKTLVKPNLADLKSLKNSLLALKGIIGANKILLAKGPGQILTNTWLEEGSVIFKTLVINPSNLISQKVQVNYYLPAEVKEEDILEKDPGLEISFDTEKNQLKVSGEFTLAAGASKTFSVEVNDIWQISQEEIQSLRKQTEELSKPLEKTAFFAQAVSLKSDINASLDKIASLLEGTVTPEQKIKAYREAEIIKKATEEKIAGLRELVGQASAAGSLFGFVGGSQAIAVWGLIIIIAAGFVFLAIYMRTITNGVSAKAKTTAEVPAGKIRGSKKDQIKLLAAIFLAATISATVSGLIVSRLISKTYEKKLSVLGETAPMATPISCIANTADQTEPTNENDEAVGGPYLVEIAETPTGWLRLRESPGGKEIGKVFPQEKYPLLEEQADWYQIGLPDGSSGWISSQYALLTE